MPHRHLPRLDQEIEENPRNFLGFFKDCIKEGNETLKSRFEEGVSANELVADRSDFIDEILSRAWQLHMPDEAEACLVAVGGYGRGELHPASDVDVLILTARDPEEFQQEIEFFIMFLWDIGLEAGHSVRSLGQCIEEARADLTVITNLIESRRICGSESLFRTLEHAIAADKIWPVADFFRGKLEEQTKRHEKFGDSAYNLEPNLKENPGGLRDIQMIGWVAKRHFNATTLYDLVEHKFLTEAEYKELKKGQDHLWRIRFALHLLTGRHEDRLLFEHQIKLAKSLGYESDDQNLAVESFMQSYYKSVIKLNRLNEMLLQHFQEVILLNSKYHEIRPINRRFQSRNGYLEVIDSSLFARHPLSMLEVFLLLEQHHEVIGIRANTIRLIRAHRHLIDNKFRSDIRSRSLFMEILRQPSGITKSLRQMNKHGILSRYIPAFRNIVGRMQYDLYHVYTVDEHTLILLRNLRRFSVPEHAHEFPLCSRIFLTLAKPELIYLAGLFHDIAKGRGGDHAILGAEDAYHFCKLHHLSDYDSRLVSWLVEKHLLMSNTAQRKDLEDPDVIKDFADEVTDLNRLDYLYLLTVADMRATNPQRWNSWKDALLRQLYTKTRHLIAQGLKASPSLDQMIQDKQLEARRLLRKENIPDDNVTDLWMSLNIDYFQQSSPNEIAWQTKQVLDSIEDAGEVVEIRPLPRRGCTEIFICAPDRRNLFAEITETMDLLGLNILEARIQTSDSGCAMNSYFVLNEDGEMISEQGQLDEIKGILLEQLTTHDKSAIQVRRTPRKQKHFATTTELKFSHDLAFDRTILQVHTTDRPGLLSLIGQIFNEHKIRLHAAKVVTIGAIAEDSFYISDEDDQPIQDYDKLDAISSVLTKRLDEIQ